MTDIEQKPETAEAEPAGSGTGGWASRVHVVVILGSGFLALTTNDSTARVVNILVCAVAVLSVVWSCAIDPAGRRGRSTAAEAKPDDPDRQATEPGSALDVDDLEGFGRR